MNSGEPRSPPNEFRRASSRDRTMPDSILDRDNARHCTDKEPEEMTRREPKEPTKREFTKREFTCALCRETFETKWTHEQAIEEMERNYPGLPEHERVTVCDTCHQTVQRWLRAHPEWNINWYQVKETKQ